MRHLVDNARPAFVLVSIAAGLLAALTACKGTAAQCNPDDGLFCGPDLLCYECPGTDHGVCTEGSASLDQDCADFAYEMTEWSSTANESGCGSSTYGGPYYGAYDGQVEAYCEGLWIEGCHDQAEEYYCSVLQGFDAENGCPYCP